MKFKRTSYLTRLAALGVAAATLMVPLGTANAKDAIQNNGVFTKSQLLKLSKESHKSYIDSYNLYKKFGSKTVVNSKKPVTVIVTLKKQPKSLSPQSESSNKAEQNRLIEKWSSKYGMTVRRQFGYLMNGFEATLPIDKMSSLQAEPEVASVAKERLYYPLENYARGLQGVNEEFKRRGLDGTGMLVSIIDTGIDPTHQDMKLDNSAKSHLKVKPRKGFTDKVPDGYNYADENYTITDSGAEQHGMHVAGIVAANGDEPGKPADKNWRVDGIAPNAQLLAMKVFSNMPGSHGARDADIVVAIEDSVKLGADVINMSLGSDNGFSGTSSATSVALKKAYEAGVLPVISAGNSGLNFSPSGGEDDALGKWDDATLGSPAAFSEAFSVASVENSHLTQLKSEWVDKNNKKTPIPYSLASGKADGKEHEIVNIGLGKKDEVKDLDLHGKYALVERGAIAFSEKFQNAIDKGADGVIVYNKAGDSAQFLGMAGVEKFTCFGASIRRDDALQIVKALKDGKVKISFNDAFMVNNNPENLKPSTFTSWGPTPELDFKPQIAGIGGNVWSTQNGNKYTSMSGTSMAAPNVSGLSALVMESYKKRFPNLPPKDRAIRVRQALMNTAMILKNKDGVPYAPRQIGAGLAQVDKAVATNVIATVNGNSYAALREVKDSGRNITVNLHNYSNKDVTYDIPQQDVINESNDKDKNTHTYISNDESLNSLSQTVTVPANKTASVTFKLDVNSSRDHYVEGWIRFTSKTNGEQDLAVPYLGFAGNWNHEPIILGPKDVYGKSGTKLLAGPYFMMPAVQVNKESDSAYEFSPNGDGVLDSLVPAMVLLRNAADLRYSILNDRGKELRVLGEEHNVSRMSLGNFGSLDKAEATYVSPVSKFDGKVYNPQKGSFETLPDGYYKYRISARLGDKFSWQNCDMRFKIDTHKPEMILSDPVNVKVDDEDDNGHPIKKDAQKITIRVKDAMKSELSDLMVSSQSVDKTIKMYDDDYEKTPCKTDSEGYHVCDVILDKDDTYVSASIKDMGGNWNDQSKVFKDKSLYLTGKSVLDGEKLGLKDLKNGKVDLIGYVSKDINHVKISVTNGSDTVQTLDLKPENMKFDAGLSLKDGKNDVKVEASDSKGAVVASDSLTIYFNSHMPTVSVTNANSDGMLPVKSDGSVEIKGKVTNTNKLQVRYKRAKTASDPDEGDWLTGEKKTTVDARDKVTVKSDGTFDITVKPLASEKTIVLVAMNDGNSIRQDIGLAGRATVSKANTDDEDGSLNLIVADNLNVIDKKYMWIHSDKTDPKDITNNSLVFRGHVNKSKNITSISFTEANRVKDNGEYEDPKPVETKPDDQGNFSIKLPMHPGVNDFHLLVKSGDKKLFDGPAAIFFDNEPPKITLSKPELYGDTLFVNKDTVDFEGTLSDDAFGYDFYINGSVVSNFMSFDGGGAAVNRKSFTTKIHVADKDHILMQFDDKNKYQFAGMIPVVFDNEIPTVNMTLLNDQKVSDSYVIKVSAKDKNIKSLHVSIDGKDVSSAENNLQKTLAANILSENEPDAAKNKPAVPNKSELTVNVPVKELSAGKHLITVEAVDYAGNVATKNTSAEFVVEKKSNDGHGNDHGSSSVTVNPPSTSTPAPKAPESTAKLDQSLKGILVAGEHMNNVVRAGKSNPVKLYFAGMDAPAKGDAGSKSHKTKVSSATSEFIKELKKNKVAYAYAYMYSSPVLLKGADGSKYVKVTLDKNGQPQFNVVIPAGYFGKHTIVLLNDKGEQLAWANVWVVPENATASDETDAEINLKYSELHSGTGFGNGLGAGSGFGTFTGTTYVGTDGNASNGSANAGAANGNAAAKQKAAEKEQAAAKSAAKKMTSDLAMTGSSVIGMVVTFMVLLASGAVTFKTRRHHTHASSK
uniref:S8 family serine peptidase n=1 Tax=uncultured Gardnerella sp. TaxID=293424 RepID=UPI002590C303|nr:S8 family serine peptidase [uncultured Gardnerella sp.]